MILPLQLRHDPAARQAAEAWFLTGNDPARWLDELARSGLAEVETRLFIIRAHASRITHVSRRSRTEADHAPITGLLIVPAPGHAPCCPPAGIPCRFLAGRLYVPVDAVLHPPVTDAELRELCPWPIAFFH